MSSYSSIGLITTKQDFSATYQRMKVKWTSWAGPHLISGIEQVIVNKKSQITQKKVSSVLSHLVEKGENGVCGQASYYQW